MPWILETTDEIDLGRWPSWTEDSVRRARAADRRAYWTPRASRG